MNRDEKMIIALTGCSHALSHAYLLIFPAVLLLLKEEFSMGYLGLGVISNIMIFSYGLGALPGGMIYNRFGPRKLYLFCFLGSALASLLVAASPSFLLFTAGLALLGVLGSIYHPLVNVLITSKVREYGKGLGIHGAAGNIGVALAPILAGLIASQWGWRWAYILFSLPGIVLSVWSLFIDMSVPEGSRAKTPANDPPGSPASSGRSLWVLFSLPLVLLYILNCLQSFSYHGAITFLPTYIATHTSFRFFSWDSVAVGGMLSGLALFTGVFGQYTGGVLIQKPNSERRLLVMAASGFPFILLMAFTRDLSLMIMALFFFFFNFSLQPMLNTLLARCTSVEARGTAYGIFFFASFGFGSLAASFAGFLAQRLGLSYIFLGLSGAVLVTIIFCLVFSRVMRDRRASPG